MCVFSKIFKSLRATSREYEIVLPQLLFLSEFTRDYIEFLSDNADIFDRSFHRKCGLLLLENNFKFSMSLPAQLAICF